MSYLSNVRNNFEMRFSKLYGFLLLCAMVFSGSNIALATTYTTRTVFSAPSATSGAGDVYFQGMAYGTYNTSPVYIAVGNISTATSYTPYAAISTDGVNWTKITTLPTASAGTGLDNAVIAKNIIFACTGGFIIQSTDGGSTWTDVTSTVTTTGDTAFTVFYNHNTSNFVAIEGDANGGIYMRTSSDGSTWSSPTTVTGLGSITPDRDMTDGTNLGLVDIGTATPTNDAWQWVAVAGEYHASMASGPPTSFTAATTQPSGLTYSSGAHPTAPTNHPSGTPGMLIVGKNASGYGLASISTDGGATWTTTASGTAALESVVWDPLDKFFIAEDTSGNMYSSTDGQTWTSMGATAPQPNGTSFITGSATDGTNFFMVDHNLILKLTKGPAQYDYNSDGYSDVLVRNTSNAEWKLYEMNGSSILSNSFVSLPNSSWTYQGSGDFGGLGSPQVLVRNSTGSLWRMYTLSGSSIVSNQLVALTTDPANVVKGIGDFDGDGKADILLRNTSTYQWTLYLMNGNTVSQTLTPALPTTSAWVSKGVGDFNGDGMTDVLMYNTSGGFYRLYEMNGGTVLSNAVTSLAPPPWTVQSIGDYDGDGKADVLMRHGTKYYWRLYEMNGSTVVNNPIIKLPPFSSWTIQETGDFNGDGTEDVIVRDSVKGFWRVYVLNGSTILSNNISLLPTDPAWTVQSNP